MNWKARLRSWPLWLAVAALIGAGLADAGIAQAPEYIQKYLDLAYPVLILLGIVVDPTTEGLSDK